ncbi:MAG: flagellar basal body L-ring protein FlgH [Myxococcales bacterium]
MFDLDPFAKELATVLTSARRLAEEPEEPRERPQVAPHDVAAVAASPTKYGLTSDNIVPSSRMADAQFEFTGRGDVADQVDRGWLAKLLDTVSPF